jgi:endonuclease/exonuclease/phosphatase family metal-dependent hydrolase
MHDGLRGKHSDGGHQMKKSQILQLIEATSVMIFLFQALRVMFSVLFGIIYDGVFEGPMGPWLVISNLLLLGCFALPAIFIKVIRHRHLHLFALLAALARIALSVNQATVRYWGALIVLAAGLIYLAGYLRSVREGRTAPIFLALGIDQLLRICGDTYDVSLREWWLPIQALWGILLLIIVLLHKSETRDEGEVENRPGAVGGIVLGGLLFLEISLLSLPNALARWSEVAYEWIAPVLLVITLLFWLPATRRGVHQRWSSQLWMRISAVALLGLGVMMGYFLKSTLAIAGLLLSQACALTILTGVFEVGEARKWSSGPSLALGMILFLVLNFLNAFAFTYPYTLPAMRERGWVVYLLAVILVLPGLRSNRNASVTMPIRKGYWEWVPLMIFLLIGIIFAWPRSYRGFPETGRLRFATYNMHYGYDDDWRFTLEEIAKTIEAEDCDVVALQEVDTGRMTSYIADDAFYLSRRLKMRVAYLPTVEHLTGIALLYRGPGVEEEAKLISSLQEQTGIIHAPLEVAGKELHAFAIWLGLSNEDTQTQILEALDYIGKRSPATFGGDFNATPESEIAEAIRAADFVDPFEALHIDPAPLTSPAIEPDERIDFVWLRGLTPTMAWVSDSLASDHRMVIVEVGFPP